MSAVGTGAPLKQSGILKKKDGAGSFIAEKASRVKDHDSEERIINVSID